MKHPNVDLALQLILLAFGTCGVGMWLSLWCSQMEIKSLRKTRLLMMFVYSWFVVGGIAAFCSIFIVSVVVYATWQWPWYGGFLMTGAYIFGMSMVQFGAMRGFYEWSNQLSAKMREPSQEVTSGMRINAMVLSKTAPPRREWINLSDVKLGPIRHEALSEEDMARLRRLHARLQPIDDWSLDYRVDLFKRDAKPGDEIRIWERIADTCDQAYDRFGPFTNEQRREILGMVSAACGAPADEFLRRNTPKLITMFQAERILALLG